MVKRAQNVKLGIFILAVAAILLSTITLVGGLRFWSDRDAYFVVSRDTVSGIGPQTTVTLFGVPIGEVEAVELDRRHPGNVWVELSVDPEVEIPVGVQAYFRATGLTGERAIDLSGDASRGDVLVPGSVIPRGQTSLEMLEARAEGIAENAEELTERATELIVTIDEILDGGPERVDRILDQTETTMESIVDASAELEKSLREGRASMESAVEKVVEDVDSVSDETTEALGRAKHAADALTRVLDHTDAVVRANDDDIREIVRTLRRTTRAAEQLVRQLRRRPSLLLRSSPPEEREPP